MTTHTESETAHDASFLLDVRTPGEFSSVRIPGSVSVPLGDLDADTARRVAEKAGKRPLLIVCKSGARAEQARKLFAKIDVDATVLQGGVDAWTADGKQVERSEGSAGMSLERQVRIAAGFLVFSGVMLSQFVNPGFVWLSGFVGAGLMFAGMTNTCAMGMLIAKLPWNRSGGSCAV